LYAYSTAVFNAYNLESISAPSNLWKKHHTHWSYF